MPHCIIELPQLLTQKIEVQTLCHEIHQLVVDTGLFSPESIKSRVIPYEVYCSGADKKAEDFIHVTVSILEGRTSEQRQSLSDSIFAYLKEYHADISNLSVNIHEMCKETYRK